ncbi:hypothetical protein [Cytobacillus sp. Bac17]|uniref:hypothetical protein n=1 Tax=Cytobacillus sp. Bac17 TaxID=2926008 RepID=UPI0021194AA4|nr:hypothetical protein [Cytobacillus sp. Bac17]
MKTLEEPPKHAIFILATTEPHKIPLTILSRCQRFDFKRITDKAIMDRMKYIVKEENVKVDEPALEILARVAQGGMRDALSMLDQAISHSDEKVTADDVIDLTGSVDIGMIGEMVNAIEQKNISVVLDLLDKTIETGKEPKFLLEDLLAYYRDILVYRRVGDKANLTKALTDQSFKGIASSVNIGRVYGIIEILSKCQSQIKYSGQDKVILEVALIKAAADNPLDELESLKQEVENLKRMLASGQFSVMAEEVAVSNAVDNEPEQKIEFQEKTSKLSEPILVEDEVEAFVRQMDGESVTCPSKEENKPSNLEKEIMELSGELEVQEEPENLKKEITFSEPADEPTVADMDPLDLLSMIENDLNGMDEKSSTEQESELLQENSKQEEDNFNPNTIEEPAPFFDQFKKDMEEGADYIQVMDEDNLASDELVPPENPIDLPETQQKERTVNESPKLKKVLGICSVAKKEYREQYNQNREEILSTLKAERMQVMALYREATVRAISSQHIVVTMPTKAKVKLLEKVMNRSIVQSVIEEVLGLSLELIVIDEEEWNLIKNEFKK